MRRREREGATCVLMAAGGRLLAAFAVCDPLKPEAPAVVTALRWAGRGALQLVEAATQQRCLSRSSRALCSDRTRR